MVMPLLIVAGSGPTLMGRNWFSRIHLNWHRIHYVHTSSLQAVLDEAEIYVTAVPRFNPAHTVLYALQDKIKVELQHLLDEGMLEPVEPIVVVVNRDKTSVRICGNFSTNLKAGQVRHTTLWTCSLRTCCNMTSAML